jgi:hypothetical protein
VQQELLLVCEAAEAVNGKLYVMGGGVDRHYTMPNVTPPIQLNVDIAASFLVGWNETNDRHAMTIRIVTEDEASVFNGDFEFVVGRPPGAKYGQDLRQTFAIRGPFPLPGAGAYKVVLELDGNRQEPPFRFWVEAMPAGPGVPVSPP